MLDLKYDESERPIIAQLFGKHPELFYEATQLVKSLGFDGCALFHFLSIFRLFRCWWAEWDHWEAPAPLELRSSTSTSTSASTIPRP